MLNLIKQGSYIGKNFEAVVTNEYTIVFFSQDTSLYSFLLLTEDLTCVHMVKTTQVLNNPNETKMDYMITMQGSMNYVKGENFIKYKDLPMFSVSLNNDVYVWTFIDNSRFESKQHEKFIDGYITPRNICADGKNLEECLRTWHLGVKKIYRYSKGIQFFNGLEVNTPKHMYLYDVSYSYVYTRAARYAVCNSGMIFNQNFRQFYNGSESSIHQNILEDNRIAEKDLIITNKGLFQQNACSVNGQDIYWSVRNYDKNAIYLNGCDEAVLCFSNPHSMQYYR